MYPGLVQVVKKELTDRFLKTLQPPEVGRLEISDMKRAGLRLRVYPSRAVWMYEKQLKGGAKRKHTFGNYCTWSRDGKREEGSFGLARARALALEIEANTALGIDRVALAAAAKLEAEETKFRQVLLSAVLDKYDALHLSGLKRGHERRQQLESALAGYLDKPATQPDRSHLQSAIDEKAAEGEKPRPTGYGPPCWRFPAGYAAG
jgi:hypothetical protein